MIAKALDLFLASATNQLGSRLIEWAVQTLAEAARGQVYRPELRQRESLLLGITT
jgi:hypothetical protein